MRKACRPRGQKSLLAQAPQLLAGTAQIGLGGWKIAGQRLDVEIFFRHTRRAQLEAQLVENCSPLSKQPSSLGEITAHGPQRRLLYPRERVDLTRDGTSGQITAAL